MIKESFLKGFLRKGISSLDKRVLRGYRRESMRGAGPDSFIAWLPIEAAKKLVGPKKVHKALWKVQKGALNADMLAGSVPQKLPLVGGLFTQHDLVPFGKGLQKEVDRPSILAPLVKARDIAAPIVVGVALEKRLRGKQTE